MSELALLVEKLENGSTDLATCFSSRPELSRKDQWQLMLADQTYRVSRNEPSDLEHYLQTVPWLANDLAYQEQLIVHEFSLRVAADSGSGPLEQRSLLEQYALRYASFGPSLVEQLRAEFDQHSTHGFESEQYGTHDTQLYGQPSDSPEPSVPIGRLSPKASRDLTGSFVSHQTVGDLEEGRYRLDRRLGQGNFGAVYLAQDRELHRQVAVKVPNRDALARLADVESYMIEARTVAALDHPHIVPVYDVGRTQDGSVFVISKFIDGCSLADWIKKQTFDFRTIARLLEQIAEALHHAHQRRLIHRDIKPANILIEESTGAPYVADFGLAVREEDCLRDGRVAGTPAFMSPEQVRGEGHRLDGRSDLFSLGVVMYQMLTGRLPFLGKSFREVAERIIAMEPMAPRKVKSDVPAELERICLKLLRKRASERYANGRELAEDLRAWLAPQVVQPALERRSQKITPRGLRSFTADDAGFFLDLLPGPRNREGLPESIAFWKERIEQRDPDQTFAVGLLYGPSGCGKSSLVKAGLIPHLSPDVVAIYIEATPEETESRLRRQLRKGSSDLAQSLDLAQMAERIRRSEGPKIVLIIDQFEQWLYSHRVDVDGELVRALRQCDGGRLQAVLMIRDDFYLAAARLMNQIDVPIVTDQNFQLVDLFDTDHARKVFCRFGESTDKLPLEASKRTPEQQAFVSSVVDGLSENNKVVSVRLSLLADMLKGRDWVPTTLDAIGGLDGIGISFLEETFASNRADARHRVHQVAVRGILRALLPESGTDIKGSMRSEEELLEASGYGNRRSDFRDLMQILDSELRLLTPTDPEGHDSQEGSDAPPRRYYQLAHDYLVPSLREWLTRKQRETKKGRAELKLAERTTGWNINQESKQLPTVWEWIAIQRLTDRRAWKESESALMRAATRYHLQRISMILGSLLLFAAAGGWMWNRIILQRREDAAAATALSWLSADVGQLKQIAPKIQAQSAWIADDFERSIRDPQSTDEDTMRALVGRHRAGGSLSKEQWRTVADTMLTKDPDDFLSICDLLREEATNLCEPFAETFLNTERSRAHRLLAAAALAAYSPDGPQWSQPAIAQFVTTEVAESNPIYLQAWRQAFRPVADRVLPCLESQFADSKTSEVERNVIANLIAEYARSDAGSLASMVAVSDPKNYPTLFEPIRQLQDAGIGALQKILDQELRPTWNDPPLNPAWKEVDATTKLRIEQAHGMLTEHLAYVQDLPIQKYFEVADTLRASGYRPTRVRAWQWQQPESDGSADGSASLLIASVFTRDGKPWQIEANVTANELPKFEDAAVKGNLVLDDLCPLPSGEGEPLRFLVLWSEPTTAKEERRIVVDVLEDQLRTVESQLSKTHGAIRVTVRTTPQGERRYTTIFSSIQTDTYIDLNHEGGDLLFRPQTEVALSNPRTTSTSDRTTEPTSSEEGNGARSPEQSIAGIWSVDTTIETQLITNASFDENRGWLRMDLLQKWVDEGWRPIAIAVEGYGKWSIGTTTPHTAIVLARPLIPEDANESLTKRKALAAVALYQLGQKDRIWKLFQAMQPDARLRSYFQAFLPKYGSDPSAILTVFLDSQPTTKSSSAFAEPSLAPLAISIGDFAEAELLNEEQLASVRDHALRLYAEDIDSGVHGVCEWLLKRLGAKAILASVMNELATGEPVGERRWYQTKTGHTFALYEPVEFVMGSPIYESERYGGPKEMDESRHRRTIDYRFAIGTHEITVEQFARFRANHEFDRNYSREQDAPANEVSWFDAVAYCNWLSDQEKLTPDQWCYQIDPQDPTQVTIPSDFLQRSGYRLPTEAEWEYTCRAGSNTARPYGENKELLGRYTWYVDNSDTQFTLPVGSLRPNDNGMFDMLGNIFEWTHDAPYPYPLNGTAPHSGQSEDMLVVKDRLRLLRGGSFNFPAMLARSSLRLNIQPDVRNFSFGLRVSRTCR
jgi:serine/threonine protein kinase/formylglycine-generating enzyme required for sulfatase activity